MKTYDFEQYSREWWDLRRGVPTGSEFKRIITAKTHALAAAHEEYIHQLIGDLYDPDYGSKDEFATLAMRRGSMMEPESRAAFEMFTEMTAKQIGFCMHDSGRFGCSPDAVLPDGTGLELKNPTAKIHTGWLLGGSLPDEHKAQVHGSMVVTGAPHWWFMSYRPMMPPLILKVERDDYTEALERCLNEFWERLETAKAKIAALDTHERAAA